MSSAQPSFQQCLYHRLEMVHCLVLIHKYCIGYHKSNMRLLSFRKSKHSTPTCKVSISCYVITLCSVFGQTIAVSYSPSFLTVYIMNSRCKVVQFILVYNLYCKQYYKLFKFSTHFNDFSK